MNDKSKGLAFSFIILDSYLKNITCNHSCLILIRLLQHTVYRVAFENYQVTVFVPECSDVQDFGCHEVCPCYITIA